MRKILVIMLVLLSIIVIPSCGNKSATTGQKEGSSEPAKNNQKNTKETIRKAESLIENYSYEEALSLLEEAGESDDTYELREYSKAMVAYERRDYTSALKIFNSLSDYRDSKEMAQKIMSLLKNVVSLIKLDSGLVLAATEASGYFLNIWGNLQKYDYRKWILFDSEGNPVIQNNGYYYDQTVTVFGDYLIWPGITAVDDGFDAYMADGFVVYDSNFNPVETSEYGVPEVLHSNLGKVSPYSDRYGSSSYEFKDADAFYFDSNLNEVDLSKYDIMTFYENNENKCFNEGYAIVKEKETGNYGILRPDNTIAMIEDFFSTIDDRVINGFLKVSKYGKYGFLNADGKLIGDGCTWDFADQFRNGYCTVKSDGKYGFIDKNGKLIGEGCIWDGCTDFYEGLCAVRTNGKWGFMDTTGQLVIPTVYSERISNFENGSAIMRDNEGYWVLIDKAGKTIIGNCYYIQEGLNEAGYAVAFRKNAENLIVPFVVDKNGKIVSNSYGAKYNYISSGAKTEELYGNILVSSSGNVVDLDEDRIITNMTVVGVMKTKDTRLLKIEYNYSYGIMDLDGKILLDCEYSAIDEIEDCDSAIAIVKKKSNSKLGVVDISGSFVFPAEYSQIEYSNGLFYLRKGNELSIFDTDMNQIL